MAVANLYRDVHLCCSRGRWPRTRVSDPGYSGIDPVDAIDFEFFRDQILNVPHDDAICFRIKIDDITRTRRASWQSFALADGKQLYAFVLAQEISIDVDEWIGDSG